MLRYLKLNSKILSQCRRSLSSLPQVRTAPISTNNHVVGGESKPDEEQKSLPGPNWTSRILKTTQMTESGRTQKMENGKNTSSKKIVLSSNPPKSLIAKKPAKNNVDIQQQQPPKQKKEKTYNNLTSEPLLERYEINQVLNNFRNNKKVLSMVKKSGMTAKMFNDLVLSFRKICLNASTNFPELYEVLCEANKKSISVTELYRFFESHARNTYTHLECLEDLKEISDLTEPANWYIEAREMKRKIIYHAGPTNSGKTYSALQDFMSSASGIYCGPLKLLASEVFSKTNQTSTACDLVTGEERRFASEDETVPAEHVACTVEMVNLDRDYECAVIDEIQMIGDIQRGWAWTRALLGLKVLDIKIKNFRKKMKNIEFKPV